MKLRMNYLPVLALNPTTQQAVGQKCATEK